MDNEPLSAEELDALWVLEARATPGPVEALKYHGPGRFQGAGPLEARAILRHAVHPGHVLVRPEGIERPWSFSALCAAKTRWFTRGGSRTLPNRS